MNILVLGGTGAIGNDLVKVLIKGKHYITVTSRSHKIRQKEYGNLTYSRGNAKNDTFPKQILKSKQFDSIVDFMLYETEAFRKRIELLLEHTKQYIYFSSSRVYAESINPINEESDRLFDTCKDSYYLSTDEYALAKARQEDILKQSGKNNWTIIRPYITYSDIRLQLGFQEKEMWLYRALHGRTIVFSKDIGERTTTLTWSGDVAVALSKIIGNDNAKGQTYHIMQTTTIKWKDILQLYVDTIENVTEKRPKVLIQDSSEILGKVSGRFLQRKYDRLYDRLFDNSKIARLYPEINRAISTEKGLKKCLENFLNSDRNFRDMNWSAEGYMDKIADEYTPLSEVKGIKNKIKYLLARYTSYFENRCQKI